MTKILHVWGAPCLFHLVYYALNAAAEFEQLYIILCIHFQIVPDHIALCAQQICQFLLNINLKPFAFHWESFGTSTYNSEPDPVFHDL